MDLRELLWYLQTTSNLRAIQRATGLHRRTIRRYQQWAATHGVLDQPLPPVEELHALMATTLELPSPPQTVSSVEPYREVVAQLHIQGVEGTAILQWLRERGYAGTLSSVYRPTWIALHGDAFTFFGGVPHRVVLDNLKAGIVQACFDDPQVQSTYRECAKHYGFLLAPCRPWTPEYKGKVEQGGVHYVKRNFLGGRRPTLLTQANAAVCQWCLATAGQRSHGTTKEAPLDRFEAIERAQLKPLPATPYDLAVWKQVKLHRDCYVVFEQAFYSAPFRLIGQRLWVRGGSQEVRLYTTRYELVATHPRAPRPGARVTQPEHLPPEKLPGAFWTRESCRALHFGDLTYRTLQRILDQGLEAEALPVTPPPVPACTFVRTAAELLGELAGGASWS
jgi:hypothetical protein